MANDTGKINIAMSIKKKAKKISGPQSAYMKKTYEVVRSWTSKTRIEYKPHAKKAGTISYDRYERYSKARTVGEALELGSKVADLLNDYQCKYLRMMSSEGNRKTLRKKGEEPGPDACKWDKVLARVRGPKEAKLRQKEKKMAHIEKLAKGFGIDIELLKQMKKSGGESFEETLQRIVAEATAEKKMSAAEGSNGKKISDADVLEVLRLWGFKRNESRQNVLPNGKTFVFSDTFGLVNGHDGSFIATASAREYPTFTRLLNRWLKDNFPKDVISDFPYTSINVNFDYGARRHRDGNNVGPSLIKALGKFQGGRLCYWPEDNKGCHVDVLPDGVKTTYDISSEFCLFDGNRAHEVEPFTGERYSVVFFTVGHYFKASPEAIQVLAGCEFPFPTEETMSKAQEMMSPPKGYPRSSWVSRPSETAGEPTGPSVIDQLVGDRATRSKKPEKANSSDAGADQHADTTGSDDNEGGLDPTKSNDETEDGKENRTPSPQKRRIRDMDERASSEKRRKAAATVDETRSDSASFKAGDVIQIKHEVASLNVSDIATKLVVGQRGSVMQVDASGDVLVHFHDHQNALQWVAQSDLGKLSLLPLPPMVPKRVVQDADESAGTSCTSNPAFKQLGAFGKAQLKKAKEKKGTCSTSEVEAFETLGNCGGDGCIEFVPDGKTESSHKKSYQRYAAYARAKTFQEALDLGASPNDISYDYQKGLLKIVTKGSGSGVGNSRFDEQARRWRKAAEKYREQMS